ncbi:MAG: winged helix-turn-helix transcriptional regulator [Paracoccus sp. (in: a-proteobacteria)]|uniref:winged helix-turn-helix transcriptional regulator n=1 Tax=Paracoccus sp. TaxID=267 RepID=UPI0026DFA05C|nr:winged helix-turn-helix transcriptional regulator [Paracoccus sp. (in: a-proteobacteria)]MDO5632179.1 winged helix-turn-helix transcriptional regulator [Paracoccus sp. (in: a-proteobacteria)]
MTEMAKLRYDEGCLAAHALNLIGDRWALLVVRELMFAPKRFQMIRAGLPGVSAAILTGRLRQLAGAGVVTHDAALGLYGLSDAGRALMPVLQSLCHWGVTQPGHDHTRFISPSALMISMTAMLDARAAAGRHFDAGFDLGAERFLWRLSDGRAQVQAVALPKGDFTLSGDGNTLAVAIYGPVPLRDLVAAGGIGVEGNVTAAQRFVSLFSLRAPEQGI